MKRRHYQNLADPGPDALRVAVETKYSRESGQCVLRLVVACIGEALEQGVVVPLVVVGINVRGAVDKPLDEGFCP